MSGAKVDPSAPVKPLPLDAEEVARMHAGGMDPDDFAAVWLRVTGIHQIGQSDHGHMVMAVTVLSEGTVIKPARVLANADGQSADLATLVRDMQPVGLRLLVKRDALTAVGGAVVDEDDTAVGEDVDVKGAADLPPLPNILGLLDD